jgi:hypothetical protein
MSALRSTEPLLRELAAELTPVRPIPRLRTAGFAVLGIFGASVAVYWLMGAPFLLPPNAQLWSNPGFLAVLAGLSIVAAGALTRGLSAAIPGSGSASRTGRVLVGIGLALIAVGTVASFVVWGGAGIAMPLETSWVCLGRAVALGVLPALVGCAYLGRGDSRSPGVAGGLAVLGAAALGAAIVHAGCGYSYVPHMLLGHVLAPVAAALVGALPLAFLIRAWSRHNAPA